MAISDLLDRVREKRESFIRDEIRDLASRGSVSWDEYRCLRMNSYEMELVYPALTTDALVRLVEQVILPNCMRARRPAITYDESLVVNFVPLLIDRLKTANGPGITEAAGARG